MMSYSGKFTLALAHGQSLPEEKGVCLELSGLDQEFMEDEAGRAADSFHKTAVAIQLEQA